MKISHLIHVLQQAKTEHGDLEVGYYDYESHFCRLVKIVSIRHKWSFQDDEKLGEKFVVLEEHLTA